METSIVHKPPVAAIIFKAPHMTFWKQWLRRPQSLWLRKAIFQIHLWTGIGLGIYVLLISVSGSAMMAISPMLRPM